LDIVSPDLRTHAEVILNRDLLKLKKYHGVDLPNIKPSRLVDVLIIAHGKDDGPLTSQVKFPIPLFPIWNRLRKSYSSNGTVDVLPLLKVTAEDKNERLVWTIPPELVPDDIMELNRSNDQWSRFLRVVKANRNKTLQ
jgi:hypothetical protein